MVYLQLPQTQTGDCINQLLGESELDCIKNLMKKIEKMYGRTRREF